MALLPTHVMMPNHLQPRQAPLRYWRCAFVYGDACRQHLCAESSVLLPQFH